MALLESKEALIEAINADIVSNGQKAITGDILNLIFNSIVQLMGTGSGGGASAEEIYSDLNDGSSLTDDMKAKNAAVYAKAKAAYEGGTPLPLCMVDLSVLAGGGSAKVIVLASMVGFGVMNEGDPVVLTLQIEFMGTSIAFEVAEDGNCDSIISA